MSKNIVICMDGTWNDPTEKTNVYKLFQALAADPEIGVPNGPIFGRHSYRKGNDLVAFYVEGVGAKGRKQGMGGGAFGVGLHERVLHAFLLASHCYQPGDKLWIFGFSRGAWSARSLAGFISAAGLLSAAEAQADDSFDNANNLWCQAKLKGALDCGKQFWAKHDAAPIQLVGVWDTVGALGIPFFNGIRVFDQIEKHLFDFADLELSNRVKYGRQALAIDERRKDFEPTLWQARDDGSIKQVWFPGVHADIGGGYPESGLSDITLQWMIDEIVALNAGLNIDSTRLHPGLDPDLRQARHDESVKKVWSFRPRNPRVIATDANLAPCVGQKIQQCPGYRPEALRLRPEFAEYFAMPAQEEEICDSGEKPPAQHLAPDEHASSDIFAQNCWNAPGIEVKQGERYHIVASGVWTDKSYPASADGYDSPNPILRAAEKLRRVEDKPWFCLVACIHPDAALEVHNPNAGNMLDGVIQNLMHSIGKFDEESQLTGVGADGTLDITKDGYLYFFANDVPWAYSNNSGYLTVGITRVV